MDNRQISEIPSNELQYQKSNFLIGAKFRYTLLENKILAYSLSQIQHAKEDKDGILVSEIKVSELKKLLGCSKSHSFYERLGPVAKALTGKKIGMTNPEQKVFDYIAVVIRATYKGGVLTIKYNPDIKPYICQINSNYTIFQLEIMCKFRSKFSFRLYELLKSKAYTPKGAPVSGEPYRIRYGLSELKLNLGVVNAELDCVQRILSNKQNPDYDKAVEESPEKMFDDWRDFKKSVLECAKKEINEITEIEFEYKPLKGSYGGKVYAIDFIVREKPDFEVNKKSKTKKLSVDELKEEDKLEIMDEINDFIDEPLKIRDIKAIGEAAGYDIERVRKAYEVATSSKQPIDNLVGFMVAAITKGYEAPVKKPRGRPKKNTFQEFEQLAYDFDDIENNFMAN